MRETGEAATTIWIAGRTAEWGWEICGAFDSEEKAVAACLGSVYFVGPLEMNATAPEPITEWPGAYRPLDIVYREGLRVPRDDPEHRSLTKMIGLRERLSKP